MLCLVSVLISKERRNLLRLGATVGIVKGRGKVEKSYQVGLKVIKHFD